MKFENNIFYNIFKYEKIDVKANENELQCRCYDEDA